MHFRSLPPVGHPIPLWPILRTLFSRKNDQRPLFIDYRTPDAVFPVSSGSSALLLAMMALKSISTRRTIILPAYTCPSVLAAAIRAGLKPCFCDLEPDSLRMDPNQLETLVGADTLAIVGIHLFGLSENIEAIRSIAHRWGAYLLEDAAQAFGTLAASGFTKGGAKSVVNRAARLGELGDIGILSFGRGKPLSLLSGGAVVVNRSELAPYVHEVYRTVPSNSRTAFHLKYLPVLIGYSLLFHPRLFWIPECLPWFGIGETVFSLDIAVARMDPTVSRLGNLMISRFEEICEKRRMKADIFADALAPLETFFRFLPSATDLETPLLRFPLMFRSPQTRDIAMARLKEAGLGASGSYPVPLHQVRGTEPFIGGGMRYPEAEAVARRILTLPLHEFVTDKDVKRIVQIIANTTTTRSY